MTAKLPVFSRKEAQEIRMQLHHGPNIPVEFLDDEELVVVIEDGYLLSGVYR